MSSPQLPLLAWRQQYDWLNVQAFGAKGNGIADDTSAIQKVLLRLSEESRANKPRRFAVIYFPPGVYRLTRTVTSGPCSGVWIVGHGRGTILKWDGEPDGVMWLSNGTVYSRHEGIAWDGHGSAAVCVEHCSQTDYETQLRYQDCAFMNAREHGLLVGRGREKQPSAEFWFVNCVFSACAAGISLLNYNDYDNIFDGCAFLNCSIGINSVNGHFAARACYFAGSTVVDVRQLAPSHASSLRLCTSKGSRRFFETGVGAHYPMKIQGCRIESWTSNEGAIVLGQRGPTTVFDCVFENGPTIVAPIQLRNPKSIQQLLIYSNCINGATHAVVERGPNSGIAEVPRGNYEPCIASSEWRPFRLRSQSNGKYFDAIRDFGAKADGVHDDTRPLERGIDAARKEGGNAVLYLPPGIYRLTESLNINGSDYVITGTGYASILEWAGGKTGTMVNVHDPRSVTLEHLNMRGPDSATRIHHTGGSAQSTMFYDGIYTNGPDWSSRGCQGLWCENLPEGAIVRIGQFVGNIRLTNCGGAKVVCALHYNSLKVDGSRGPKTGICGFMFHNDAAHNYALEVLDNQDVLVADFYSESNKRFLLCTGSEGQPSGRVTIGCSKMSPTESECVTLRDYEGRIFIGGGDSYNPSHWGQPLEIAHEGNRRLDFIMGGQGWWAVEPRMKIGSGLRYVSIQNLLMENKYPEYAEKSLPEIRPSGAEKSVILAFDDFRELAETYLKLFYSQANRRRGRDSSR